MLQRLNSEPRRVLMTVDAAGGVWRYAMDLAASMSQDGVQFVFAGLGPEPSAAQRAEAEALGDLIWLDVPPDWLTEDEASLDALPGALEALAPNVDLMHLNAPTQATGLKAQVPVVVVSHSCVPSWFATVKNAVCPPYWSWQHSRNRAGLMAADAVVAPSRSHADALERSYGRLSNLQVIHNGSKSAPQSEVKKQPFILAAGRWWDEGKNGAVLDAMAGMVDWPVKLAGSTRGPAGQGVEFNNVELLGQLDAPAMAQQFRDAAIVVSPSLYEPFGLVPLEAARAGSALVLSDIPTYRELWNDVALFGSPRDPSALAEKINRLITEPELRSALAGKARERSAQYSVAGQAEAMRKVYRLLCQQRVR